MFFFQVATTETTNNEKEEGAEENTKLPMWERDYLLAPNTGLSGEYLEMSEFFSSECSSCAARDPRIIVT